MSLIRTIPLMLTLITLLACTASEDPYVAYGNGDYETAREKLEPLAAEGDQVAQTYLGSIYQMGLGVKKDYQKAYELYEQAAKAGYAKAQYNVGLMHYEGLGQEKNLHRAYSWFHLAGEQQHEIAQERLRQMSNELTPNQIMQAKAWGAKQLN